MEKAQAIYLDNKGWFWVVWIGQRSFYYGPYRTRSHAERQGPQDDQANIVKKPPAPSVRRRR